MTVMLCGIYVHSFFQSNTLGAAELKRTPSRKRSRSDDTSSSINWTPDSDQLKRKKLRKIDNPKFIGSTPAGPEERRARGEKLALPRYYN